MYLGFWIVSIKLGQGRGAFKLNFTSPRSLAEDFEFSQDAWRRGFTCGRVHGIVREQSPTTLRDFLKQRRRWFMGIRDIDGL
jgi:cellulose synthase/poly-beta-1,6-N-acetylglucosamine synthase-like glycosyltransferase